MIPGTKKITIAVTGILLGCLFYSIFALCRADYLQEKAIILANHQKHASLWVNSAVEAGQYWFERLEQTTAKISGSEMYRLFAKELAALNEKDLLDVQSGDNESAEADQDLSTLAIQVPIIRGTLYEFMQQHQLLDIRIVNTQGKTMLAATTLAPPISPLQKTLATRTFEADTLCFAPLQMTPDGLVLHYAVPLNPELSGNTPAQAVLLLSKNVTHIVDALLNSTLPPSSLCEAVLAQQDGKSLHLFNRNPSATLTVQERILYSANLSFDMRPGFVLPGESYSKFMRIANSPFRVGLEMPANFAEAEISALVVRQSIFGIALIAAITAGTALLWRSSVWRAQRLNARKVQSLYTVIAQQKLLLDGINASLGMGLALINSKGRIRVANKAFETMGNFHLTEGPKHLTEVFDGPIATRILLQMQALTYATEEKNFDVDVKSPHGSENYHVTLYGYGDPSLRGNPTQTIDGAVVIFQRVYKDEHTADKHARAEQKKVAPPQSALFHRFPRS